MQFLDPGQKEELIVAAREAARMAYCPFSKFRVGAAVLADGRIFRGCNVENASYGLTTCAERVAVFNAVSAGAKRIAALAVTCPDAPDVVDAGARMPCGACRQVLAEFAESDSVVIVDHVGEFSLDQLLPHAFKLSMRPF